MSQSSSVTLLQGFHADPEMLVSPLGHTMVTVPITLLHSTKQNLDTVMASVFKHSGRPILRRTLASLHSYSMLG